ncbi:MAG: phosphotransferase [Gammaproteobacteria bacterium]|nr:phosphotransferase [Gammaproteobacteria bacterium]
MPAAHDPRLDQLLAWAKTCLDAENLGCAPASADASFRRYFRLTLAGGGTLIAMDAPPPQEDCRPFVHVAGLMAQAGLHAPAVLHADLERGFLLLSDLGAQTYLDVMDESNADALFGAAIAALVAWQKSSREGELPPYDQALLQRELDLFPDWYVGRHLGLSLDDEELALWQDGCALLIDSALAQPKVFVHRDYMPRNLMISEPNPGVLDFQDAVWGPISYDLVSLFRDAFLSWPEERVEGWARLYHGQALAAGLPVQADYAEFRRAFDWMGLQRHLKVLGIFARINYRDGKPKYLADTPRFLAYVRRIGGHYAELKPLLELLDRLEARAGK